MEGTVARSTRLSLNSSCVAPSSDVAQFSAGGTRPVRDVTHSLTVGATSTCVPAHPHVFAA